MAKTMTDPHLQKEHSEHTESAAQSDGYQSALSDHSSQALIRRIDKRLLPILGALYSIALIDRINISAARVAGMETDLELYVGTRYTVALLVFFIPYFLFELPSNLILRKVGSANWLAFIAFSWGVVMLGQGFLHDWEALTACRLLLGFFEAGFFPGCVYLISCWYIRYEVQKRLAAFYLISALVGGFSSILAFGLQQMEGVGGLRGWRWIFIIEGLMTIVIAILAWFLIIDFPDKAATKGFLSQQDSDFIQSRIEDDRGDAVADTLTWRKFFHNLADLKLWAFALMFMNTTMPAYAFSYFAPVIIRGMGYSGGIANVLSAPPVVFAVISAFIFAWLSDKFHVRSPAILSQATITIVGLMLTAYHSNDSVRYFGIFLGQAGCQGNIPTVLAYQSNNIRLQSKRAVGSALQIGFGAIGGIIASTVFREQDAPLYRPGLWTTAGLQIFTIGLTISTTLYFWTKNKQQAQGTLKTPIEGQEGLRYTL